MFVWERDRALEKRLLFDAAKVHNVGTSHVLSLYQTADRRTLPGLVRLGDRSMLAEAAEETADLANYLRWELVRSHSPAWSEVINRALGDVVLTWSSLEQAAHIGTDMGVPFATLTRTITRESQAR